MNNLPRFLKTYKETSSLTDTCTKRCVTFHLGTCTKGFSQLKKIPLDIVDVCFLRFTHLYCTTVLELWCNKGV